MRMDRDFIYCPGCARYSIVQWRRELRGWECEDCTYTQPDEEREPCTAHETLAS